jgi:hypothetical protein
MSWAKKNLSVIVTIVIAVVGAATAFGAVTGQLSHISDNVDKLDDRALEAKEERALNRQDIKILEHRFSDVADRLEKAVNRLEAKTHPPGGG